MVPPLETIAGQVRTDNTFKRANESLIQKTVEQIEQIEQNFRDISVFRSYNGHKVPVEGVPYWAFDAKALNRYANQSGRGNMRYLFTMQGQYEGIAKEKDNGNYRRIA